MEDLIDVNILLDNNIIELFNEIEDLTTPLLTATSSSIVTPSAIVTTIPTNTIITTTTNATDKNVHYQSNSRFVAVILTINNSVAESLAKNKETQQLLIDSKLTHNIEQILKNYWSPWSIDITEDELYKTVYLQGLYVMSRRSLRLLKSAVRTLLRKYRNNKLLIMYEVIKHNNNNSNNNKNNYLTTWQIVKTLNCLYKNDENTIGTVRKGNTILIISHEQQQKTWNNLVTTFEKTLFIVKADIIKCLWISC